MGIYMKAYNFGPDEKQKPSGTVDYEVVKNGTNEKIFEFSEAVADIPGASTSQVTIEKLLPLKTLHAGPVHPEDEGDRQHQKTDVNPQRQFYGKLEGGRVSRSAR